MNLLTAVRQNRFTAVAILFAGILSALWLVWFIGATQYQSVINKWIQVGRDEGYEITYDRREQFGFPHQTVLRYVNVHWKNTNGIEFHAGDLDISAELWATKKFKAKFKGQVEIDVPLDDGQGALILAGENGSVNVNLSDSGTWEDCAISMKTARIGRTPDYLFLADEMKMSSHRPADDPTDSKTSGLTLSLEADNLTLPAAMPATFGPKMARMQMDLRLMGPVPDFRKKDSVLAWNKMNGLVEFDRLNMQWGPLLVNSKGTMDLDDDLQPEGAFAAIVGHQNEVLQTLTKNGYIAAAQQDMMASAMRVLAKPTPIDGIDGIEVPIAVQLGGFFFGPIRIFAFAPIEWDQ